MSTEAGQVKVLPAYMVRHLIIKNCLTDKKMVMVPTDRKYRTITRGEVTEKMVELGLHKEEYVPDFFDCDDYALKFAAGLAKYCVGIIHVYNTDYGEKDPHYRHALNVFIDHNMVVWMVDVGRGLLFKPPSDTYKIYFLYI